MHAKYTHDPAIQKIQETDIAKFLRRETKHPSIVTYRSEWNGAWVMAFKSGHEMIDVGFLGDGSGKSEEKCWLSADQKKYLIDRINNLITVAEAKKQLKQARREQWKNVDEVEKELIEAVRATVRSVYNRMGEVAAQKTLERAKQSSLVAHRIQDEKLPKSVHKLGG